MESKKAKILEMIFAKILLKTRKFTGGRNSTGKITSRHRGGNLSKRFFLSNFRRRIFNTIGEVISIKKDVIRSSFIALIFYRKFGVYEYILSPHNITKGSFVIAFKTILTEESIFWFNLSKFYLNLGNSFLLKNLKIGSKVFNVENFPGNGGKFFRAAGMLAKIVQKIVFSLTCIYVALRVKSGKLFYINGMCIGTLGQCSNPKHKKKTLRKAGMNRNLGWRPSVRGVAMNPIDHPHGGGEGKTSGGRSSVSAWGKLTKGKRTLSFYKRSKKKRFIKRMLFRYDLN